MANHRRRRQMTDIRHEIELVTPGLNFLEDQGAGAKSVIERTKKILHEAVDRIDALEAALQTIDNAIPKNDPTLPAICLIAGDIAEGALNGTWPAFGVMPRAALEEKTDD